MTILIVTNSNDPTVDYVSQKFKSKNIPFVRLDTDWFMTEVQHSFGVSTGNLPYSMRLEVKGESVDVNGIRGVWYRRPKDPIPDPLITDPEAIKYCTTEANYFLKCLYVLLEKKKWVSHPKNISYANVKLHQLYLARSLGFAIPKSLCTNDPNLALNFIREVGDVVVKPFKSNVVETDNGPAVIYTSRVDESAIKGISAIKFAPHFFQEEIAKVKEYRVTIIGRDAFITSIDSQSDPNLKLDWRTATNRPKEWSTDDLPDETLKKCFAMVEAYNLNYGAFDFALTPDGQIVFFELNPNGQWAWQEDYLDLPMSDALIRTLGY